MYFDLDDIKNGTILGVPEEELAPLVERLLKGMHTTSR